MIKSEHCHLLYLIKCSRIQSVAYLMDKKNFMKELRRFNQKELEKKSEDPMTANDMDQDHSGTMIKIVSFFGFKIIRITMFIILTSYFLAMTFYIFCQITMENNIEEFPDHEYFITYFKLHEKTPLQ